MYNLLAFVGQSFTTFAKHYFHNWRSFVTGGIIVIGLVITIIGGLKLSKAFAKLKIKNTTTYKVVLAWLSVLLTVVFTVVLSWVKSSLSDYLVWNCVVNSVGTVLTYWLWEHTAMRDGITWLGGKVWHLVFKTKPSNPAELSAAIGRAYDEVESLLIPKKSTSEFKYKDDDLKNL